MQDISIDRIEFIDLRTQRDRVRAAIEQGWRKVVDHGQFIMGPEVIELEKKLASFSDVSEVISCSSGTDALWLALLALEARPGDAVFIPSWTFTATAEAVCLVGATPVFVDVEAETMNMAPASLAAGVEWIRCHSDLKPKAVIPVDLFGLPGNYNAINDIARAANLTVIADAAQSFGATVGDRRVGTLADVTATSFFPAKPLGCWGDGGAIFTNDSELAEKLRSIRIHGRGSGGKYDNVRIGTNARLDTLQAVVLLEKLKIFDEELAARQQAAEHYMKNLRGWVQLPRIPKGTRSSWAQFTIRTPRRDHMREHLAKAGIRTEIYYPRPLHSQTPYRNFPVLPGGLPVTERLKNEVLSLPMHPYLTISQIDYVSSMARAALQ